MNKIIAVGCAWLMLLTPLASFAQPGPDNGGPDNRGQGGQQGRPPQGGGQGRPQEQGRPPQQGGGQNRPPQHGGQQQYRPGPSRDQAYHPQPGMPRPHNEWHRGGFAPPQYRGDRYWVTDWHSRHLRQPPRDHRWLYVNGDYVLVAITTGAIVQILSGY
ncbi:integral membrane protein-like protein [Pseudomonas sp. M47T1]|uniref:RcnB family protein n=1 Tax=Pseudomonas sp. M47T1 TaxID=1179778 RepID=UPI0002607271|nr:RcnB family protein [Pseudomonas sp. M47T1]EIK96122.1 integral membrane protein-like protein [Pseudomonas sp. M47T1]